MSTRSLVAAVVLSSMGSLPACAGGVGVLGDSYSDEYRFYAPHREAARNWVEILHATRGVDFGPYQAESRDEPRNSGFAYNWARSGATSADMIASGQHSGLAEQVRRGEVGMAVVMVGGNDFIAALRASDPRSALEGLSGRVLANLRTAQEALLDASPGVRVAMATVADVRDLPEFRDLIRSGAIPPASAALAGSEIEALNVAIRRLASDPARPPDRGRVAVFDFAAINRVSRLISSRSVFVGGRRIDRERIGDAPDRLFLADARHLGTAGQGMIAKYLVECLNARFDAGIAPLGDREILSLAEAVAQASPATTSAAPSSVASGGSRGD